MQEGQPAQPETAEAEARPPALEPTPSNDDAEALRRENARLAEALTAAEPVLAKAREAEEASKTELQRALERAQKAEEAACAASSQINRLKAANRHGVGADYLDLIAPGTPEEVEDRAKRLGKLIAQSKPAPPPNERPVESLKPGASADKRPPADDSYPSSWQPRHMSNRQQGE